MRQGLTFSELSVGLVFLALGVLACLSPAQADTFWALRAGEDLWSNGRVPLVDTYSHTALGRPWPNHEWLWQGLAYGLYKVGGLPVLSLGVAGLAIGATVIAYRLMVGRPMVRLVVLVAGSSLGANAWALRPQVMSLLLLAVLMWLLVHRRHRWIPPLFALWANLHGGVVLGGLVMVAATGTAFFCERRRFRRLAVVTVLGGAATALTPLGVGLWTFIAHWLVAARQTGVSEWLPVYPVDAEGIMFWILVVVFCALLGWRWRRTTDQAIPSRSPTPLSRSDDKWAERVLVIAALALLPCAIRSVRNVSPFLLVAMPAATRLLPTKFLVPRASPATADHARLNLGLFAALAVLALGSVVACWSIPVAMLGWRPLAGAAARAIAACPGPLYNGYNDGGTLIWFVRDKPVFIDGRHDPYPPELVVEDREVERGADFRPLFSRTGVRCAVLSANALLAGRLKDAGWRQRYGDRLWIVLEAPL